jgi:hypothetical protein
MDRRGKLLLMQNILERLGDCCDEWQRADTRCERLLADSVERDLTEFRRLCVSLRPDAGRPCMA